MVIKLLLIQALNAERFDYVPTPPLGLAYLVTALEKRFGEETFDVLYAEKDIVKTLNDFNPDVVGISAMSQNYNFAKRYAKEVKEYNPDVPVIIGGVHVSMLPHTMTKDMDIGVMGEGEYTLCELFEIYKETGTFKNLDKVEGISFWKNNEVHTTKPRPLEKNLDNFGSPKWEIFPDFGKGGKVPMISSRGCPYKCVFCSSTRFFKQVRFHSAEHIIKELKEIRKRFKTEKEIVWSDDLFIANRERLRKLSKMIVDEGLHKKHYFVVSARANLVDEEVARLLKDMNTKYVMMGLESGCPKTLEFLKGKSVTVEDNKNAIKILHKHGMNPNGPFIIGSPDETKEEMLETLNFIKNNDLQYYYVFLLQPLPGTPLWDFAKEKGLIPEDDNDFPWDTLRFEGTVESSWDDLVVLSQTMTREELYEVRAEFTKYFRWFKFRNRIKTAYRKPKEIIPFFWHRMRNIVAG